MAFPPTTHSLNANLHNQPTTQKTTHNPTQSTTLITPHATHTSLMPTQDKPNPTSIQRKLNQPQHNPSSTETHTPTQLTPTPNQVDHWALGERELMCQWRVGTRNAAMCGGRRELETSGMMALCLWTSEDGLAPSVEPRSKPSTWSILRSPVDRPEPPLSRSLTPPATKASTSTTAMMSTPSSHKKPAAAASLSGGRSSSSVVEAINGVGVGGNGDGGVDAATAGAATTAAAAAAGAGAVPVGAAANDVGRTPAVAAAADGASRGPACSSSGLKRSRLEMEAGSSGTAGGKTGGPGVGPAGSGSGTETETGLGTGAETETGTGAGSEMNGRRGAGAAAAAGGVNSEEPPWLNSPRNEGMGEVGPSASGVAAAGGGAGQRSGGVERAASTGWLTEESGGDGGGGGCAAVDKTGAGDSVNGDSRSGRRTGVGGGGGRGGGGGGRDYGTCLGSWHKCWERDHPPLGKVVGVPRQAKARGVRILYDHSAFVRQLEVSLRHTRGKGGGEEGPGEEGWDGAEGLVGMKAWLVLLFVYGRRVFVGGLEGGPFFSNSRLCCRMGLRGPNSDVVFLLCNILSIRHPHNGVVSVILTFMSQILCFHSLFCRFAGKLWEEAAAGAEYRGGSRVASNTAGKLHTALTALVKVALSFVSFMFCFGLMQMGKHGAFSHNISTYFAVCRLSPFRTYPYFFRQIS